MTASRIVAHLAHAVGEFLTASRLAGTRAPIAVNESILHARAACEHLVDAATLISPEAGLRVREAYRRAIEDAHRRAVSRRADLHASDLDESDAASCASEGTGGLVVDVTAAATDDKGLHGEEGSARRIVGTNATIDFAGDPPPRLERFGCTFAIPMSREDHARVVAMFTPEDHPGFDDEGGN